MGELGWAATPSTTSALQGEIVCLSCKCPGPYVLRNKADSVLTCMAFQDLNDILLLDIPDINILIFRPTDDMFAIENRKCRPCAELLIHMALVRLQALPLSKVPEAYCAVES